MRRSRYFIVVAAWAALFGTSVPALAQRLLGIDVSYYQGNISAANWTTLHTTNSRDFVIIRASRGGTTGFYNSANPSQDTLSRRYDDPYFVQNINRSTTAGLFAGSYHFSRPDVIETTENSGGIRNTGTDEADHFIQMAGAFMRPGYLLPVHDFEAGDGIRTDAEMAQFCIDFSARIYEKMGIRPAIYTNGNYAANILAASGGSLPAQVVAAYPKLWSARWPNQSDPNSIDVQSPNNPKDTYTPIYGPWDDAGTTHPWTFWQYASTMRLSGYNNGNSNIDVDVVNGGIEVLKDQLVPALWMKDSDGVYRDGNWSNFAKWNSGQAPIAPVTGPGQMTPIGTQTMPTARLPGTVVGTVDVTDGQNDTVILDVPSASITVTLDSGTYNIRKLYAREALNITGGSLGTNYIPPDPNVAYPSDYAPLSPFSAQFSAAVSLSGTGSLSVHTLQVDSTRTFTLGGGTLSFNTINLMPHSTTPAKIAVSGDVSINPLSNATAAIVKGTGSGSTGLIDLNGGTRIFNVGNGSSAVDLSVEVPITNGGLSKSGAGIMRLTAANTYSGGTTVSNGTLLVNNTTGSGTGTAAVTVNGGTLGGTGAISGAVTVNAGGHLAPGASIESLNVGSLTLNPGSVLDIELAAPGTSDLLNVTATGGLMLNGGAVSLTNSGGMAAGTYTLIDYAGTLGGSLASLGTPTGPAGFLYSLLDTGSVINLSVVALTGLNGDFDNNGVVDASDFVLWRNGNSPLANDPTPGNQAGDFDVWKANFGRTVGSASGQLAVPEPACGVLLLAAGFLLLNIRRYL